MSSFIFSTPGKDGADSMSRKLFINFSSSFSENFLGADRQIKRPCGLIWTIQQNDMMDEHLSLSTGVFGNGGDLQHIEEAAPPPRMP